MITYRSLRQEHNFGMSLVVCYAFLVKKLIFLVASNGLLLVKKVYAMMFDCSLEFFIMKSLKLMIFKMIYFLKDLGGFDYFRNDTMLINHECFY
jgi:hypothetical protein